MHNADLAAPERLELRLTRDFTSREKRQLMDLAQKLMWRRSARFGDYVWSYLWIGFGAFLALSILLAANRLLSIAPNLAIQLVFAGIGYAIALLLAQWTANRLQERYYWTGAQPGDRFIAEASGLTAVSAHGTFRCDWSAVSAVADSAQYLAVTFPNGRAFLLAKAAFEGQDVERFSAELLRRWKPA